MFFLTQFFLQIPCVIREISGKKSRLTFIILDLFAFSGKFNFVYNLEEKIQGIFYTRIISFSHLNVAILEYSNLSKAQNINDRMSPVSDMDSSGF